MFNIGGTTAESIVKIYKDLVPTDLRPLLENLGITFATSQPFCITMQQLSKLTAVDIKKILQENRIKLMSPVGTEKKGNKANLLRTLKSVLIETTEVDSNQHKLYKLVFANQFQQQRSIKDEVEQKCIESWFYNKRIQGGINADKGLGKTLMAGHLNEEKMLCALPSFLQQHCVDVVVGNIRRYGLIEKEKGIVVSPDAVMEIKLTSYSDMRLHLVELKTKVAISAIQSASNLAQTHGVFNEIDFSDSVCKQLVPHRFQILHQAVVADLKEVLYVVATKTKILYAVLVHFDNYVLTSWLNIIKGMITCVPWILSNDDDNIQFPLIPRDGYGGCVDDHTLKSNFYLARALRKLVIEKGKPYPPALRIVPSPVVMWNHCKGMTDVYSRCMKNIKPTFHSLHPYAFIWIRLLMTMMWNTHILYRLFQIEHMLPNIKTIDQLRNLLNKESSFQESIYDIATQYKIKDIPIPINTINADAGINDNENDLNNDYTISNLNNKSRNYNKLKYLNNDEGKRRRIDGSHVHVPQKLSQKRRCLFCNKTTTTICATCSTNEVVFPMCTSTMETENGRLCLATCFQRCHTSQTIRPDFSRRRRLSQSKRDANAANSLKRRRLSEDSSDENLSDENLNAELISTLFTDTTNV